jgi:hypothetical protein
MKYHKTTTNELVTTFKRGDIMSSVKAAKKIKLDRSCWNKNPSKRTPPVFVS